MKVIFICGALEPGRDGVGDYTRRIAAALTKEGVEVGIIALRDGYIAKVIDGEQYVDEIKIPVLRIPSMTSRQKAYINASKWIGGISPDYLSLQYVPYSFSLKGLPFALDKELNKIGKSQKWHIMFHELWIGMDNEAPFTDKIIGWLQRRIVFSIIDTLKPVIIHTQTSLYQLQLKKYRIDCGYLPLFSNIPFLQNESNTTRKPVIEETKTSIVLFGGIHYGAPVMQFAGEIKTYEKKHDVKVVLTIIGRAGSAQAEWEDAWNSLGLELNVMGEQPGEIISQTLKAASLGISTTPLFLAEKSGTIAAMREHGLNVLCISRPWHSNLADDIQTPSGIFAYYDGIFEKMINMSKLQPVEGITEVSHKLAVELLSKS